MKLTAYSTEVVDAVMKDILSGMSQRKAAKKWGISIPTVSRWRKESGVEISYHMVSSNNGFDSLHTSVKAISY